MHRGRRTIVHASAFLALVALLLATGAGPALADSRGGPPAKQRASSEAPQGHRPHDGARQHESRAPKRVESNQAFGQDEGSGSAPSHGRDDHRKGPRHESDASGEQRGPKGDDRPPTEEPANPPAAVDQEAEPAQAPTSSTPPPKAVPTAPRPAAVRALSDGLGVTARVGSPAAPTTPLSTSVAPPVDPGEGDDQAPAVDPLLGALTPSPALPFLPSLDNATFPALLLGALGLFLALFGRGDRRDPKLVEAVVDDQAQDVDFS